MAQPSSSSSQDFLVSPDELFDSLQDISSSTLNADSTPAFQPANVVAPSTFVATDMEEIPGVLSPGQVKGLADLSIPESFSQIPQVDPLADLVARYFHRQERPTRNPALRSLVDGEDYELAIPDMLRNHTWYALATYTESQLTRSRPRDVEGLFKLWYFRILALVRLRFFQIANNELEKLGSLNRPEFCYESHPLLFPGRQGSMVPFELRLLHAQLPGTLGNAHLSLDRIYDLILLVKTNIAKLERLATTDSLREAVEWRERETPLMMLSTRYLMELRDFTAAATQLRRIADMNPSNAAYLSFCGRMHLQLGDLLEGEHLFNHIQKLPEADQIMNAFNAGFLRVAKGDWDQARESFMEILRIDANNREASNNVALCLLYQGKLDDAIVQLERRMETSKTASTISPGPLLNLCTLYELRTGDGGLLRKRELLRKVAEIGGDDLPMECFKLAV